MDQSTLKEVYLKWDGTHIGHLKTLYQESIDDASFIPHTIALLTAGKGVEVPGSWVVKHHVEQGNLLNTTQVDQLVRCLGALHYWQAQLHLLQIIPMISLTEEQAEHLEPVVRNHLSSDRAFVKASAFAAYFEIVKFFPGLKNEFRLLSEDSLEKVSASVKVKIRRILNQLDGDKNK
ncbi:hypothetical protein [Cyclobacterium lianum]|nr:hypothetical protein [Cyclobacterium lianum]